jgi:tetratricopeptide (TPR) repeat protein
VDGPYRLQSSSLTWSSRCLRGALIAITAIFGLSIQTVPAQTVSPHPSDPVTIQGSVRDKNGTPVGDASVRLEQKSPAEGTKEILTKTNPLGAFVFPTIEPGTYLISAEKSGLRSQVADLSVSPGSNQAHIDLVLEESSPNTSSNSSSPLSADALVFADKPNFTVAGITDWTAVGGHGSDASLRTSEALARETTTLKPESTVAGSTASAITGTANETEAKLRAAVAEAPRSFQANHQLGEFCFQAGSYREAIPLLDTAYEINRADHANEFDLALAYKAAGDSSKAREHIQRLLTLEDNADLHRALGDLDEEMGDSLAAVHEYEQAVRLDPSEQNYFAWGSELLLHRAVWPAAEVFRKGSEAHPKSARMLAALGAALFASALYDDAAQRLCEASDLNPADPAPYVFLGKIDIAAPDPLPCVEPKLMRFLEEQPGDARASYYYAMAVWKRRKGAGNSNDLQQVDTLLVKAVTLDPRYYDAYFQLGNICSDQRSFDKAIAYYLKAIEINPQLGEAHYRLGVAYEHTGEPAKAKQEFQLHDEIEKAQAAAVERQRQEVKQFLVVLQGQPAVR